MRVTARTGHGETQGGRGWIDARGAAGANGGWLWMKDGEGTFMLTEMVAGGRVMVVEMT